MFKRLSLVLLALTLAGAVHAAGPRPDKDPETRNARDVARAAEWIRDGKYDRSIRVLKEIIERDPQNADAYNLLGYAHRKTGKLEDSSGYYARALAVNPDHKGALEYQGELFLMQNNPDAARANLERLAALCPDGCEERTALEAAIAAHEKGEQPKPESRW
jgi:Tfp pilus assembly protein PilF